MSQVRFINMSYDEILLFKAALKPRSVSKVQSAQAYEAKCAEVMLNISAKLIAQASKQQYNNSNTTH